MGNEAPNRSGSEAPPRPPTLKDLAKLCAELNRFGAHFVVVGGLAMNQAGYSRTTDDIDLLVETTPENEARVINALLTLPEKAAAELKPGEVGEYGVVRVGDEVLVDLMKSGCGVTYADAIKDAPVFTIEGVPIPFASPRTLWRMKQTVRAKDIPDRLYLSGLILKYTNVLLLHLFGRHTMVLACRDTVHFVSYCPPQKSGNYLGGPPNIRCRILKLRAPE